MEKQINKEHSLDILYWYGERQLTAAFMVAFYQIDAIAVSELPVKRRYVLEHVNDKPIYGDSHGRIDYWCFFENSDIYIEAKHFNLSNNSIKIKDSVMELLKSDKVKLGKTKKHIDKDRLNTNKEPFKLLIHSYSIFLKDAEYNLENMNDLMNQFQVKIDKTKKVKYDEVFCYEMHHSLVNKTWSGTVKNKKRWPCLFIAIKRL